MKGKILFTIASGLLLLGAGCTLNTPQYPSSNTQSYVPPAPQIQPQPKEVALYTNQLYGFELVVPSQCTQFAKTKEYAKGFYYQNNRNASVDFILVDSKVNPSEFTAVQYEVMSQSQYNDISTEELPGKPAIVLALPNQMLLTARYGNGDPSEQMGWVRNNCINSPHLITN